jgi:hypothetical protein
MYYDSIDADGFTIPGAVGINASGSTHHAYGFNMGNPVTVNNIAGAGAVPTAGSVVIDGVNKTTSQGNSAIKRQLVNTSMGVSITRFTGTGADMTIDHNLGVKPDLVIHKSLDISGSWTYIFDVYDGTNDYFTTGQNGGESAITATGGGYSTVADSTSFYLGNQTLNEDYVAIAIASTPGFCRVGRYDGNNSVDGPFIHTGFRPAMVMVKLLEGGANSPIRVRDNLFQPLNRANLPVLDFNRHHPALVGSNRDMYFHSNGFKLKVASTTSNANTNAYIYIAFADQGAKFGNAK